MKRIPELRDLSEDHHYGLALARMARKAAAGAGGVSADDAWAEVAAKFEADLEPHFRIEESIIVPALEHLGESRLTQRLLDEHAMLRGFLVPGRDRTAAELGHFGELLDRHIRFEERELFEVAQRRMGHDELSRVAQACRARQRET
jgi:hypothetical protein